jgi:phosphoribosyl 1,2-cyclic phosphodiesterase
VLVLDAGTGIRPLGAELLARGTRHIHLLLTHLHLDHLEGLRFFAPLWDERVTLDVWGPRSPVLSLRDRILRSFSPPLFPIDFRDVPARIEFHDVPREPWTLEGVSLAAALVLHPGPTVGVRVDTGAASFAYIPDHEPALAGLADRPPEWISGGMLALGADLLFHDSQYFEDEYASRIGWGHSSVVDAVAFSHAVGAKQLVLFHHEPDHPDEALDHLGEQARELAGADGEPPILARERMAFELP